MPSPVAATPPSPSPFAALLLLLSALCLLPCAAQTTLTTNMYVYPTLTNSTAYVYPGTNFVDVTRYTTVGWKLSFACGAASTATNLVAFQVSHDATNWSTRPYTIWSVAANGTSNVVETTYFSIGPNRYIRPMYVTNSGSVNATNVLLEGLLKGYLRD